jgi:uncharacterized protein (DUF2336 family)
MGYLVEQSKRVDTYQNPLLRRPELGEDLARRMYWWVSAALRKHILANFKISAAEFDDVLEGAVVELASHVPPEDESKSTELAEKLRTENAITPQLLVQSLRQGEIALFEALFSKMTGIRLTLVRRMLFERGGEGLAIACRAKRIEAPLFASIYLLSRKARPSDPPPARGEVKRVLDLYEQIALEAADELLKKWQRDQDFLKAVWQIDQPPPTHAAR